MAYAAWGSQIVSLSRQSTVETGWWLIYRCSLLGWGIVEVK